MKKLSHYVVLTFLFSCCLKANNIQLANISLTGQNVASSFTMIEFDISWENSWRLSGGVSNWDAAWVFVKYRVSGGQWMHAYLNNTGHTAGTGTSATIDVGLMNTANAFNASTNPAMGVFIYRDAHGIGNFSNTNVQLRWNYGVNGISYSDAVDIKVFAVEMVYVPSGAFQVGDGATTNIQGQFRNATTNTPFTISSENAITLGGITAGNLTNNNNSGMSSSDDFSSGTTRTLPATFPKGFNAFYCMKYELTQQQWIDFFNTLGTTQKTARDITGGSYSVYGKGTDGIINRNNISYTSGDATLNGGTFGNVACNFLSLADGLAFADWASLRPMSELEYEKACRGPITPVVNEYAWGSTSITAATVPPTNSGASNEIATNSSANACYNLLASSQGPMRVGCFATSSSTRVSSGASYYGIMELSGNLLERVVTIGFSTGRNFMGTIHGDGLLSTSGFAVFTTWPGFASGANTGSGGSGFRGGGYASTFAVLRTSSRISASSPSNSRSRDFGFRAVRTAP